MYVAIAEALFTIRDNVDRLWDTSAGDAYALSLFITSFDFIMTLVVVRNCLGYTRSTTAQLQGAHIDILKGLAEVAMMKESIHEVDQCHSCRSKDSCTITNKVDAVIKSPRTCRPQGHRNNVPSNDVSGYYKVSIIFPFP